MKARLAALLAPVAVAACLLAPVARADQGISVVASQRLDGRLTDLTLSTPALSSPRHVRVLVPAGYAGHPDARYPVLYLLHGALADWRSWTDAGDAERITAGLNAIVVMPEGGTAAGTRTGSTAAPAARRSGRPSTSTSSSPGSTATTARWPTATGAPSPGCRWAASER